MIKNFRMKNLKVDLQKSRSKYGCRFVASFTWACILTLSMSTVHAQIGGKTAADGPFLIDDVEISNLNAEGVQRNWVPDFVKDVTTPLLAVTLTSASLTPASGQSPIGALEFTIVPEFNTISDGFGVPIPSVAGASTATNPGNIASFQALTFFSCFSPSMSNQEFQVLLFCYPQNGDATFPTLLWKFTPALGTSFQSVTINLRTPNSILNNPANLTIEQLLGNTRFLYFYSFAAPVITGPNSTLRLYVDDIRLVGGASAAESAWLLMP